MWFIVPGKEKCTAHVKYEHEAEDYHVQHSSFGAWMYSCLSIVDCLLS